MAWIALVMLVGSAERVFGQTQPLITEFGFPNGDARLNGVAVADFNGDGIPDAAAVSGGVAVYLGNGDGTFKTPVSYFPDLGLVAGAIAAGDFNGDGKIDLCVADGIGNLWVLLGNGDGTFKTPISTPIPPIPGADPPSSETAVQLVSIAIADFNKDGKQDVIASSSNGGDGIGMVLLFLGNGDGTFASASSFGAFAGGQIVAADFNGDGKADFAVLSPYAVTVVLGNGQDGFLNEFAYPFSSLEAACGPVTSLVVADFNGDGIPDLAAGLCTNENNAPASYGATVEVFLGNGDGTFSGQYESTINNMTPEGFSVALGGMGAADFNGDGNVDLFLGTYYGNFLVPGTGNGLFQTSIQIQDGSAGTGYGGVAVADLNGDHKPDIVGVEGYELASILNTPGTVGAAILPASWDFGADVVVGGTAPTAAIGIANPGTSAMEFSGLAVSDTTDFSATTTCGSSLAPATSCTINIKFNPPTTGTKTASVTFTTNDPLAKNVKIPVTGGAIAPVVSTIPADVQFSYQKVGTTSSPQTLQITNSGVGPLSPLTISIQGDFQQTNNCPSSLAQGASCTATITYVPLVPGSETGRLLFTSNAIPAQSAVALTGIGYVVGPIISVAPTTFNFGSQYVGTSSAPSVVTVQNNGDAPFAIASVAATAGFVPLSTCGNSVQPSFSCAIGIFFDPATTGSQTGTLTITDNLSSSPQTVALTGNGTAITVGASSGSSTAQTFASGKAAYQISIAPVAGFSGTVNLSCVGLAAGYNCTLSQPSAVLTGSGSAAVTVSVTASTTTAAGSEGKPAYRGLGTMALACPIALIFLGAGIYPRFRRRFLAIGLLAVAAAFTSSCGSTSSTIGSGSSQTYVFFLEAQPASGITIETPLTLTVPN